MADEPAISFRLPDQQEVAVYLVRLPDGRIVSRTADELTRIPEQGVVIGGGAQLRGRKE
jgi:hypothetical protein